MACDRIIFGADAQLVFSMNQEARKKAAVVGSYEARIITALTARSFHKNQTLIHGLSEEMRQLHDRNSHSIQQAKIKFSLKPLSMIDLPSFSADLMVQSLSLYRNALAVLLDGVGYVVLSPCSKKTTVIQLFEAKNMRLRCVEWINQETIAFGCEDNKQIYLLNTRKLDTFCYHAVDVHQRAARITKITRFSDSTFFTGYTSGVLLHHDISTGKVIRLLDRSNDAIVSISPSANRARVAVGFDSGITKIYSLMIYGDVTELREDATVPGGRAFCWQPGSNSNYITGSAKDRTIRYFQLPSTMPTYTTCVAEAVTSLVFLDKKIFLAGCEGFLAHFCIAQKDIWQVNAEKMKPGVSLINVLYEQSVGLITASSDETLSTYAPVVSEDKDPTQKSEDSSQSILSAAKIR